MWSLSVPHGYPKWLHGFPYPRPASAKNSSRPPLRASPENSWAKLSMGNTGPNSGPVEVTSSLPALQPIPKRDLEKPSNTAHGRKATGEDFHCISGHLGPDGNPHSTN